MMGTRQSGMVEESVLRLAGDAVLMKQVEQAVESVFAQPENEENRALMQYARREMENRGLVVARN